MKRFSVMMWVVETDDEIERFETDDFKEACEVCRNYERIHRGGGRFSFYIKDHRPHLNH